MIAPIPVHLSVNPAAVTISTAAAITGKVSKKFAWARASRPTIGRGYVLREAEDLEAAKVA